MNHSADEILNNYLQVKKSISSISNKAELLAVTKFQDKEKIKPLLDAGHRIYGESRIEEAIEKWINLKEVYKDIELHFIGRIQSRKISKVVEFFDVIHSLDSLSAAEKISKSACAIGKKQRVFIQINIGNEPQKSGVLLQDVDGLYKAIKDLSHLQIEGFMCIPPNEKDVSHYFKKMRDVTYGYGLVQLSMGMSNDYKLALKYDATIVRVGSIIFGERVIQ
ncbi:YggS family pyridoxal phosphate-dependent enzyme [Pantoea sp. Z09]|uniref:YggS family pyridoxal phosphate-dependent enzyme n=1 Tax=Pantoea sp. Z09 TaxID=2886821 RepID=UPI001EFE4126|nr:YggS family pyridoxal phosphate-dependent enzyme [Pantoea sp. Z09]